MDIPPVYIDGNYSLNQGHLRVRVPHEKVVYCDNVTVNAPRDESRWLDCAFFVMRYYGHSEAQIRAVMDDWEPLPPLPVYPAFPCEYCNNDGLTEKIEAELDEVWPDEKKLPPFMPRQTVPLIVLPGSMDPFIPTDKLHLNLGEEEPL